MHHINPEGEDGGVVYCEMQGRENSAESLGYIEMIRKIYPDCGYSAETGGILHNLRTSTTNKKVNVMPQLSPFALNNINSNFFYNHIQVRDYHSEFYRPENLTVTITGQVKVDEVEKALSQLEKRILEKVHCFC